MQFETTIKISISIVKCDLQEEVSYNRRVQTNDFAIENIVFAMFLENRNFVHHIIIKVFSFAFMSYS